MLYKRRDQHRELCGLRVSTALLDAPNVIVADGNASSDYVRFEPAPKGLRIVDRELTFAVYWTDSDPILEFRKKFAKCAEVLVPDCVPAQFIVGVYVSCEETATRLSESPLDVAIDRNLFFL